VAPPSVGGLGLPRNYPLLLPRKSKYYGTGGVPLLLEIRSSSGSLVAVSYAAAASYGVGFSAGWYLSLESCLRSRSVKVAPLLAWVMNRLRTAHTSDRQLVSPGNRPITFVRLRTSQVTARAGSSIATVDGALASMRR
jgi:hypothetical protein